MINWEGIAELAYRAYREERVRRGDLEAYSDVPPYWKDLSEDRKQAWVAAVGEACRMFGVAATA